MNLYILNLLDLVFTLYALNHGAVELNPLMRCVPFQIFYKVIVIGALFWFLNHFAEDGNKVAITGMPLLTAAYAAVNLWHIVNISTALMGGAFPH